MEPNIQYLKQRSKLLCELRSYFDGRGFLEVQPPCLSRDCVVDSYIDPVSVATDQFRLASMSLPPHFYLQTSPESAMKRLLAAGSPSIYSIGPAFRSGERGSLHNVEFTMLEWYEVGGDICSAVELLGHLVAQLLGQDGYDICSYRELFQRAVGFDPIEGPIERLRGILATSDHDLAESIGEDRDDLLDAILSQQIQGDLGRGRPLIVKNYPLSQAALARPAVDDPQCAARFELFAGGIELANGYDELRDADVLIQRAGDSNRKRFIRGRPTVSVDTSLVQAMRKGIPPCAGVALGVDRLLMRIVGAKSIRDVLPFPIEIA